MLCRSCSLLMTEWSLKSQIWKTIFAPVMPYTLPDDCILATLYYCYCYCSYTYWCSTYTYSQSSANQHKIHLNVHWCCAEKLFIYCQSTLKFQYCHKSGKKNSFVPVMHAICITTWLLDNALLLFLFLLNNMLLKHLFKLNDSLVRLYCSITCFNVNTRDFLGTKQNWPR